MEPTVLGRCGDRVETRADNGGPLAMSGSFPVQVAAGGDGRFQGTVSVSNRSTTPVTGTAASQADVFVTRSGEIVATPVAKDDLGVLVEIDPGAERVFSAIGSLLSCAAPADEARARPLPPGRYEVYAVLSVHGGGDQAVTVVGGPWPLQVT